MYRTETWSTFGVMAGSRDRRAWPGAGWYCLVAVGMGLVFGVGQGPEFSLSGETDSRTSDVCVTR